MAKLNLLYSSQQIQEKVSEYAKKINTEYQQEKLYCIGIMNGALFFMSDLLKQLNGHIIVDTISASSYVADKSSNHLIYHKKITKNITNQHILIIEDIIDTGLTLTEIVKEIKLLKPKSIKVVAVIDKLQKNETLNFTYDALFTTKADFLVGYGLDYDDNYRQLPSIYEVTEYK